MDDLATKDVRTAWRRTVVHDEHLAQLAEAAVRGEDGLAGRVFVNGDSLTVIDAHQRYVAASAPYAPYTAGELARAWLQSVLDRAGRTRVSNAQLVGGLRLSPALFFDPPADRGGEWAMVDVKAAYWTLYSRRALDCMFRVSTGFDWDPGNRGEWRPGVLTIPEGDLAWVGEEKALRNAAWGVMQGGNISWYEGGAIRSKPSRSRYAAPDLVQFVLAQMNAVAAEARALGAVMWLTDAAICRPDQVNLIRDVLHARWGLDVALKAYGGGYLYGLGDYEIGDLETAGEHEQRGGYEGVTVLTSKTRERLARV